MKARNYLLAVVVFSLIAMFAITAGARAEPIEEAAFVEVIYKARVITVENTNQTDISGWKSPIINQTVDVEVLEGEYKGKTLEATNVLSGTPGMDLFINPGDYVLVTIQEMTLDDGSKSIANTFVSEHWRSSATNWLIALFAVLMIAIGRLQGLKSLIALGITIAGIYKVLLPGLVAGKDPVFLTILLLIVVTMITMLLVAGFSKKSLAAILGTFGGLVFAALLSQLFGDWAQLQGLATEEEKMLLYVDGISIDMKGLLFSGIVIGAVGAIMDVSISIASAISEISLADPSKKLMDLFKAGMNVGKDIMGAMANTLILAYTGGALPLLLLLIVYNMAPIKVLNLELIVTEIVRALVGSIALITSIPITAIISSWLLGKHNPKKESLLLDQEIE